MSRGAGRYNFWVARAIHCIGRDIISRLQMQTRNRLVATG